MTHKAFGAVAIVLGICITSAYAQNYVSSLPAYPKVWYRPDSVTINPKICDTVAMPSVYTMMMVYRPLQPDSMHQLWKLSRTDDKYYSVGTHTISTERWEMPLSTAKTRSNACIYTMQHTLQSDTSYHDIAQLFIGADTALCASNIELYEAAYFDSRMPMCQSLMFQTYLAIKHGVTLDSVFYISTSGDTLWNAIEYKKYYHRIQGIGADSVYDLYSTQSTSLEDSLIRISVNDTLPIGHYVLIGDNDAEAEWQPYESSLAVLRRIWKMNIAGEREHNVQVRISPHVLQETSDTTWLAVLNEDYQVIDLIRPDSIDSCNYYYSIRAHKDMLFSLAGHFAHQNMPRKSKQPNVGMVNGPDYVNVSPNPTHGDYIVRIHLAEEKPVAIVTRDMTGQMVSSQQLNCVTDYEYKDRISSSGVYTISVTDNKHNVIATTDIIVY